MIRVLHIFHSMANGGVENFVMNYYRHIDRSKVQFDFLTSVDQEGYFDKEIISLGGKIFHASPLSKNPFRNFLSIAEIVRKNNYSIVHRHTGSAFGYFDLWAAKFGGAKQLILHSHNPQVGRPWLHFLCSKLMAFDCIKLACAKDSGEFLFGHKSTFKILNDAIDCDKYVFKPDVRADVREKLKIGDAFAVGHIGRFEEQKNHGRLVKLFAEIHKTIPNSVLVCVGTGSLMEKTMNEVRALGLEDSVHFLGTRDDVDKLLNAFDIFLLPSLYEGFGIVLVEAQANGLRCFASRDKICEEVDLTGNVSFIPLKESDEVWAQKILQSDLSRDVEAPQKVRDKGFDINNTAVELAEFYDNCNGV